MARFRRKKWLQLCLAVLFAACLTVWLSSLFLHVGPRQLLDQMLVRTPGELIRYAKVRLQGHSKLEWLFDPVLSRLQRNLERSTDGLTLPNLGKGAPSATVGDVGLVATVSNVGDLLRALETAKPGHNIVLAPGVYRINQNVHVRAAGWAGAPIVVQAAAPGLSVLEFNAGEGFVVAQPYWAFDGLKIIGVCSQETYCEHAFHVVGRGAHFSLKNSHVENFNAHIKINGAEGQWPDHGELAHNTLLNTHARRTDKPVTPIDLVGANHWRIVDNRVLNFVKADSPQPSYGIFVKGASEGARIERNLVVCSPSDISAPGLRVGISFGGGTTGAHYCRDGSCARYEHTLGLAANNVIAHCNDVGLDVNHSSRILLAHNTLINTAGIGLRAGAAEIRGYGNLFEGKLSVRDTSVLKDEMNQPMVARQVFHDPDQLAFDWLSMPERIPSIAAVPRDFCGQARTTGTLPGAIEAGSRC